MRTTGNIKRLFALVVAVALVGGCVTDRTGPKEGLGSLIGAGLGALTGAQVGSGTGQLAATAAGAVVGASAGRDAGESLDRADRLAAAGENIPVYSNGTPAPPQGHRPRRGTSDVSEGYRSGAYERPARFSKEECGYSFENEYRETNKGGRWRSERRWRNEEVRSVRCVQPPEFSDGLRDGGRGSLRRRMERWPDGSRQLTRRHW